MSVLASDEAVIFVIGGFDGIRLLCQQPRACMSEVAQFDLRFEQKKSLIHRRALCVYALHENHAHITWHLAEISRN